MPLCVYWSSNQGVDRIFSLMVPPVVLTLGFVILNVPLLRYLPRKALDEAELVLIYTMLTVAGAMASEWMDVINPIIHSFGLYAERNPYYKTYILPFIPDWMFLKDADKLRDYGTGGHFLIYFLHKLPLWIIPIASWTLFVFLISFAMLCINSLMREQWTRQERFSFPIIQLPIAIAQGGGNSPFWRNRWMWGGFAAMAFIDLLNGFHFMYPALPWINVRFIGDVQQWLPNPPWNAIGWTPIGIFPYMAAIGLFMPTDLLFSCIFFFFVRKAMQVAAGAMGYEQGVFGGGGLVPSAPYFSEQTWGAFLGLFVTAFWMSRRYLREVWQAILHGERRGQGVPHRWAFLGLVGSLGGLGVMGTQIGLAFWFVVGDILLYLAFSTALTRMRAQLGPPTHEMAFMGPNQLLVDFAGTRGITDETIARVVTTFHMTNRIHRTHAMPHMLEGFKLGERCRLNQSGMFLAIALAIIAGTLMGHLMRVYMGYRDGAGDAGGETGGVILELVTRRRPPNPTAILSVFVGFGVVFLLDAIRFRFPAFPLHPVGYALCMNFGVDYYWFGLLIVLIVKVFVQRYYGLKGYDKLHHVALGVILGEFAAETIWATYTMATKIATYSISINGRLGWNQ